MKYFPTSLLGSFPSCTFPTPSLGPGFSVAPVACHLYGSWLCSRDSAVGFFHPPSWRKLREPHDLKRKSFMFKEKWDIKEKDTWEKGGEKRRQLAHLTSSSHKMSSKHWLEKLYFLFIQEEPCNAKQGTYWEICTFIGGTWNLAKELFMNFI